MKLFQHFRYALIACTLICITACENTTQSLFGSYSYKVSGKLAIDGSREMISDEIGSLVIINLNSDTLLLAFNAEEGGVFTTQAIVENNQLILTPCHRLLTISYIVTESSLLGGTSNRTIYKDYQVEVYGDATIYDQTIIFNLQYSGKALDSNSTIKCNNITLIAKKE